MTTMQTSNLPRGNQWTLPPSGYTGEMNWMKFGKARIKVGHGFSPFWLMEIERIRHNIEACIIVVTGKGGTGKTYFALRNAEILDPRFNVQQQVPFGNEEFMALIGENSPLKMGQAIVVDESQFGMSNRDWADNMQKDLMKQIEAIRSKGLVIFIVALNMKTLDVIARNYVITHRIHMKRRGVGTAYKFYMPAFADEPYKYRMGTVKLQMPGRTCEHPSCLRCKFSGVRSSQWLLRNQWEKEGYTPCSNIRAVYERKKKAFLEEEASKSAQKRVEKIASKNKTAEDQKLVAMMAPLYHSLPSNKRGNRKDFNAFWLKLDELAGKHLPERQAERIRFLLENPARENPRD